MCLRWFGLWFGTGPGAKRAALYARPTYTPSNVVQAFGREQVLGTGQIPFDLEWYTNHVSGWRPAKPRSQIPFPLRPSNLRMRPAVPLPATLSRFFSTFILRKTAKQIAVHAIFVRACWIQVCTGKMEEPKNIHTQAYVVRHKGAPFELQDVILDEVRPDEVLVEMRYTGLCHTVWPYTENQH